MSELDNYTEEEKQKAVQSLLKQQEYQLRYYQENKNERAEYYQENKEEILEQQHQYRLEHKNERAEHRQQYNLEHKDEIAEHGRQRFQEHKDEIREQHRQYRQEHPEVHKAVRSRQRARIANSDGHFTAEEFRLLCESLDNRCFYCEQQLPLTPDHIVPISKSGSNRIENIVPACRSCNARKSTKTFDEFLKELRP